MKTQCFKNTFLPIILLALTIFFIADLVSAESNERSAILERGRLPSNLQLFEKTPQSYVVTTDYFHKDIFGSLFRKERYQGTYTRALSNGKVKWENVTSEVVNDGKAPFGKGNLLTFMEGFSYEVTDDMLKVESFPNFPPTDVNAKNLVWDLMAFESFAWMCFDSLKLNDTMDAMAFNGKISIGGVGTFENKNILLTWTGITIKNRETCAVIEFLAMDNPLDLSVDTENFKLVAKGRSHYWGTILVSLSDKQIEGATMHEDVLLDMVLPDGTKMLANSTRLITVVKVL
jgi:hypothetical protein